MGSSGSHGSAELIAERVEFSRKLGVQKDIVLHGGGNTSVKTVENDHTGRVIDVLRVKGSGSDLATIDSHGFTGLRMDDLLAAMNIESMSDVEMAAYLRKSMIDPSEPSPSVETFMHAFLPQRFVDHSHADAILVITNTKLSDSEISSLFPDVIVIGYHQPGFKLARSFLNSVRNIPEGTRGVILRKHGLFTFGETGEESYRRHMEIVEEARKILSGKVTGNVFDSAYPKSESEKFLDEIRVIRGSLSVNSRKILLLNRSREAVEIACSSQAEKFSSSGPATPDMLIRTKYDYLYVPDEEGVIKRIQEYAEKYTRGYEKYVNGRYPMHDPFPSIIVIRGFGIITSAISRNECRIIMDQFMHSIQVNAMAEKFAGHSFISQEESYEMEYWPLEEEKLKKVKPKPLQGKISIVTGAASGIGYTSARELSINGSLVFALDLSEDVMGAAKKLSEETGNEVIGIRCDVSREEDVISAFRKVVEESGGVDILFNNAGILRSASIESLKISDLDQHYNVNARGAFLMTREAFRIMRDSSLGGNIVFNITKNLLHPGPEMLSYGSTKAMAAQMCHYVAKEGGKYGIRANIINPDKVFRGSLIWENGVLEARAKAKGQTVQEYKTANLLRREVLPEHVARILLSLVDEDIFGVTTDAMIPVDGGVL